MWLLVLAAAAGILTLAASSEKRESPDASPAFLVEVEGPIGPATDLFLERSMEKAEEANAPVVIIRMDTPGGLESSMRTLVRKILDSRVPVAVYVAPEGARATSAGTYILYSAHVAAMAPGTHVGAATPVQLGGGMAPGEDAGENEDEPAPDRGSAAERKMVSDAAAFIKGLAELRGRNAEWAERAVREGVSLTSREALEENVIDLLVSDVPSLLEEMDGMTVSVRGEERVLSIPSLEYRTIEPDWRTRLLSIITNPNVAYILMLLGIYGLILEFANPGALVPGVTGAICLLLGLFALQLLPINYAGLALIFLGVALMIAEAFAPSFGALGIGGVIAFIAGSIMLIDTDIPGFELYRPLIAAFAGISAVIFIFVMAMALKAWRRPVVSGRESLVGSLATAIEDFDREGRVSVFGESWQAKAATPVRKGQPVRITAVDNLVLTVEPESTTSEKGDAP